MEAALKKDGPGSNHGTGRLSTEKRVLMIPAMAELLPEMFQATPLKPAV